MSKLQGSDWNPAVYEGFARARARPAEDLLAALPRGLPWSVIVDLGCGTGGLARRLADAHPSARVIGVDSSPVMLTEAQARAPSGQTTWLLASVERWLATTSPASVDLIISNAALHWVADHDRLFPALVERLTPGGCLAVQMPRNFGEPSFTVLRELLAEPPWLETLGALSPPVRVQQPEVYADLLLDRTRTLDVWETQYLHVLTGPRPVLDWMRGAALTPLLGVLPPTQEARFLAEYGRRLGQAHPARACGRTLFPFRRLFLIAQR